MEEKLITLPAIALRGLCVLPEMIQHFDISRDISVSAVEHAMVGEQKVFLGGAKQLLNQPEFQDVGRVKNLLGILEEEKVVKDILNAGDDSGLKVTIGSENKFTGIKDCSMVQATYRLNGQIVGTMAVLGPTRMEYRKVIAVMNYLHKYLETILKDPK